MSQQTFVVCAAVLIVFDKVSWKEYKALQSQKLHI